jgi:ATP-dependent Lon protease
MTILLPSNKTRQEETKFPLIPLRNQVPFPFVELPVIFGRTKSINGLLEAYDDGEKVIVVAQKDPEIDDPIQEDLYKVGVICEIDHLVRVDGTVHASFQGLKRVNLEAVNEVEDYWQGEISQFQSEPGASEDELKILADHLVRKVKEAFNLGRSFDPMILRKLSQNEKINLAELADRIGFSLDLNVEDKQKLLEYKSLKKRLKEITDRLTHEIKVLKLDQSIEKKTKDKFEKRMKENILRERKKAIDKELEKIGASGEDDEIRELRKKIKKSNMPKEVRKKAHKELDRLDKMNAFAPGASYIRTYIEWLTEIPWQADKTKKVKLKKAQKILDKDHHGLDDVKERITEYLAVMKLKEKRNNKKDKDSLKIANGASNILCFIGPPGVGKTSLGKSIARALDREFVRVSLGGIRDEAEIRGHRRTYVGALPGRIIQGIKDAGTTNPVFMLDEIDKVGQDFRGDPSAALLEALDPEQNREFSDHYLEVPYDLSDVFFILTGNVTDTIPSPLLDRLEVIRFSGYTEEEKVKIAQKHLFPKQLNQHALTEKDFKMTDKLATDLVKRYTREAGVRELERVIAKLCRKVAMRKAEDNDLKPKMNIRTAHRLLGPPKFSRRLKGKTDEVGVSTGLAWTQTGGEILFIEVALMPGKGNLVLTGQLGDVMKESCKAALSYVRSHWKEFGIKDKDFAKKTDFHIHVPEGAVKKDGPSAGVAIASALVSALTEKEVKRDIGMTGEITLRGRVLEIGGVKEKVLAAHRAGIEKVILPKKNKKDLREVPDDVKEKLDFVFADRLNDVIAEAIK